MKRRILHHSKRAGCLATVTVIVLFCAMALWMTDIQAAEKTGAEQELWNISETDLTLQYDDRYSLSGLYEGWTVVSVETKEVSSFQVSGGRNTGIQDTDVILCDGDSGLELTAAGVGEAELLLVPENQASQARAILSGNTLDTDNQDAEIQNTATIEAVRIHVKVEPAKLTLMYVAGQSNAEGLCSSNTGYRRQDSVACLPGTVYSTYAPSSSSKKYSDSITGISFSSYCTAKNASDFVAGGMRDERSASGKTMKYALNTLTEEGAGKTGPDGALAYEWNYLTGDKVWVVNTAWSGSSISTWIPGGSNFERSNAVYVQVQKTYEAELLAGHYVQGNTLMFWLQGETGDKNKTAKAYRISFESMYQAMVENLGLDAFGIIMVRSSSGSYTNAEDITMNGPRIAQYTIGNSKEMDKAFVVSNANEQWVSNAGVKTYFQNAYPGGYLSYPMHGGSSVLPVSVAKVHSDIHYSQIAHNENGITAAQGMYAVIYETEKNSATTISWRDADGNTTAKTINYVTVDRDEIRTLVPVTDPLCNSKQINYSMTGKDYVEYDEMAGTVTWKKVGLSTLYARNAKGKLLSTVVITVEDSTDMRWVAGDFTGLYYYNGTWWYLKDGYVRKDYEGVVKHEDEWWYVKNGKVDFTYNGFASNSNGWWYLEDGKVTFQKNDVIKGTVKGETGWWYVKKSKVTFTDTVAKNKNGWWYIKNGKVDFTYNGFANNSNGWWYLEDGKVTFQKNDVIKGTVKGTNAWWYVKESKVTFTETVAKNKNGWWYIKNGKVDFTYNGAARNSNGWWYIRNGKVDFTYNGTLKKNGKTWYFVNGKRSAVK